MHATLQIIELLIITQTINKIQAIDLLYYLFWRTQKKIRKIYMDMFTLF